MILRIFREPLAVVLLLILIGMITAQIALGILLKPAIERQIRVIFHTPVSVEQAGANVFSGSIWMKQLRIKNAAGYQNSDFLVVKKLYININFLSLLTSEFAINRIRLEEPILHVEVNSEGVSNLTYFNDQAKRWGGKFFLKTKKVIRLITSFRAEQFSVRNGRLYMSDQRHKDRRRFFRIPSFSLARLSYPPDSREALPSILHLNAKAEGAEEQELIVIGKVNFFSDKKNFDLTASVRNLTVEEYRNWADEFPLGLDQGVIQLKAKMVCRQDQLEMEQQVKIQNVRLNSPVFARETKRMPGLSFAPKTIVKFFNESKSITEPLEFSFGLSGNLGDPRFDLMAEMKTKFVQELERHVQERLEALT